jgi:hypothetical protein
MAKSIKKKPAKKSFTAKSLVALVDGVARPVNIHIDFFSGIGQITVVLFRNGILINMQSISTDGDIHFADVQSRDTIAVNGVCAGKCTITINTATNAPTPQSFSKIITTGYTVL